MPRTYPSKILGQTKPAPKAKGSLKTHRFWGGSLQLNLKGWLRGLQRASSEGVARPRQASYLFICSKELAAPYLVGSLSYTETT